MSMTELFPWQELAARVMDALADAQDRTNAAYPEHVKCYPSWERKPRHLRWLAEMFRTGRPTGNGAGQPDVLAALAATTAAPPDALGAIAIEELAQLGYTFDGNKMMPPDFVGELLHVVQVATATGLPALTEEALAEKIRSHGAYGGLAAVLMPFIAQHAAPQAHADARDVESDYQRGYRHGYNRRDAEVQGALL